MPGPPRAVTTSEPDGSPDGDGRETVARSFRQIPAVAMLAAACVLAWPVAARADGTLLSSASGLLSPVLAVPAATLPAIPAQLLPAAGPDRPHPSTATPQAYIKNRVEA